MKTTPITLSDADAKSILGSLWPRRTNTWPIPAYAGYWMRACPSNSPQPFIHPAGAKVNTTKPDGMYIYSHITSGFADVIPIEVCVSMQNFNDKRSRYTPTSGNVHLTLPLKWLNSTIVIQRGRDRQIWRASEWFDSAPTDDVCLTIRHLRALFVLREQDYKCFGANGLPAGHEYFCMHQDLNQIKDPTMQEFVKGMALMKHFKRAP